MWIDLPMLNPARCLRRRPQTRDALVGLVRALEGCRKPVSYMPVNRWPPGTAAHEGTTLD
jgi:hypothetical protein